MNKLFKKGLVSLAAASVLTTGAMAASDGVVNSTTKDYTLSCNPTTVETGGKVYCSLILLNEDEKIDVLNGGSVTDVIFNVSTLNGSTKKDFNTTTDTDSDYFKAKNTNTGFSSGVLNFTIDYNGAKVGKDTVTVLGYIDDLDDDSLVLGTKTVTIDVTTPTNQAEMLQIKSIAPKNSDDGTAGTYDETLFDSENNATIKAGAEGIIKIQAYNENGETTTAQNSEVTVTFIPQDNKTDNGNNAKDADEITLTGEMENGLAEITIPADTLTKAGSYLVVVSTPTGRETSNKDYIATNMELPTNSSYTDGGEDNTTKAFVEPLNIEAIEPAKLGFTYDSVDMMALGGNGTNTVKSALQDADLCLLDKYGNKADKDKVESKVTVTVESSNGKIIKGSHDSTTVEISASNNCVGTSNFYLATKDNLDTMEITLDTDTKTGTSTITATADGLEDGSMNVNLYRLAVVPFFNSIENNSSFKLNSGVYGYSNLDQADVNLTAGSTADHNMSLVVAGTYVGLITAAGSCDKGDSVYDLNSSAFSFDDGTDITSNDNTYDLNTTFFTDISGAVFNISLKDDDGNVKDTLSNTFMDSSSKATKLKFKKAGTYDFVITVDASGITSTNYKKIEFLPFDSAKINELFASGGKNEDDNSTGKELKLTVNANKNTIASMDVGKFVKKDPLRGERNFGSTDGTFVSLDTLTLKQSSSGNSVGLVIESFDSDGSDIGYSTNDINYTFVVYDAYGNDITETTTTSATVTVASTDGELTPNGYGYTGSNLGNPSSGSNTEAKFTLNNHTDDINISYNKTGVDTLKFAATELGVDPITKTVQVVDASSALDTIVISTGSDYMLTNSQSVVTVSALKNDGKAFNFTGVDKLTVLISDPNMVTLYDNDGAEIEHGGTIDDNGAGINNSSNDGKFAFRLKTANNTGEVTITVKNAGGTVVGNKTINIVESVKDFPSPISQIDVATPSVNIVESTTQEVEITVTKENGQPAANTTVNISSDNSSVVTVPATVTTDENGKATVTLTAGTVKSAANVVVTASSVSETIAVTVTSATTMSVSSEVVTVDAGSSTTVTVANANGDVAVTSSDSTVAVASVDGNTITITGGEAGTAEITVTDGTTTKTIAVTVNEVEEPAATDPKTKVENTLAGQTFDIAGYFGRYDFDGNGEADAYNDWAYTDYAGTYVFQLLGYPSGQGYGDTPFGWKRVDIAPSDVARDFVAVRYGSGKFDWVMIKSGCSEIYKLVSATSDGKFNYDINEDGSVTTDDALNLTCTTSPDGKVTFESK